MITATYVGTVATSRLGRLAPGGRHQIAVEALTNEAWTATADDLDKATVDELSGLCAALGVAPAEAKPTKAHLVAALEPVLGPRFDNAPDPTPEADPETGAN